MSQATDDDLLKSGKNERSRTLAQLYTDMARLAPCRKSGPCADSHNEATIDCPKAIWQQAARMAEQMIEEQ